MCSSYTTVEDIILLIVSIPIIIANAAEIKLLMKRRAHFVPYEQLLLSLSICDLLVGISMGILSIVDLAARGQSSMEVVKVAGAISLWCSVLLSVLHINWLATDRYIAVSYPFRHKIWVTKRKIDLTIAFTWMSSITSAVFSAVFRGSNVIRTSLKDSVLSGCATVIILYSIIVYRVAVERRRVVAGGQSAQHAQRRGRERRLVLICLIVVAVCLISSLPFIVLTYMTKCSFAGDILLVCSSLLNPFIYYFWKYFEQRRGNQNLDSDSRK